MRNLTITRNKKRTGCLGKVKIYITDEVHPELFINTQACRKLGTLKNGETKSFVIGDEEAKIYAISDKFSRNLSNDYINIPEGNEDISLDGNTSFNLARLNGFTFNAESNEEKLAHRQKMNKRGIITIIVAAISDF